jgi:DNA replication and repair protein RecF
VNLVEIRATDFRNLSTSVVSWGHRSNLVTGGNGEGKTNLLEAVAVLGNLRSFRVASMRQVAAHGASEFLLEGRVHKASGTVRIAQHVVVGTPLRRTLEIAGATASIAQYLQVFPVFSLAGSDRELVQGSPGVRRAFLDRFAFLLEPVYYDELRDFQRTLRQRNAALTTQTGDREMAAWEGRLARTAAVVIQRRRTAASRLTEAFGPLYDELRGRGVPNVSVAYRYEGGLEEDESAKKVEEYYLKRYNETRARDRRNGFTGEGPHRHDLALRTDERSVRHILSSGQTKVLAAALRLASLMQVEEQRAERIPVIIDDVDAELDTEVLSRLIAHLDGQRQLFLSSADGKGLGGLVAGSSRFEIHRGAVVDRAGE